MFIMDKDCLMANRTNESGLGDNWSFVFRSSQHFGTDQFSEKSLWLANLLLKELPLNNQLPSWNSCLFSKFEKDLF